MSIHTFNVKPSNASACRYSNMLSVQVFKQGHMRTGQLHLDREDFDEAKEYINKVLQLSPGQHDSYALLLKAVLNLKTGQFHVDKHSAKVTECVTA